MRWLIFSKDGRIRWHSNVSIFNGGNGERIDRVLNSETPKFVDRSDKLKNSMIDKFCDVTPGAANWSKYRGKAGQDKIPWDYLS